MEHGIVCMHPLSVKHIERIEERDYWCVSIHFQSFHIFSFENMEEIKRQIYGIF